MDELIARVTTALGVDATVAKIAIGHVLVFLQKELPDGPVAELIGGLPGAQEAVDAAAASDPGASGGVLGGLMSGAGGLMALAGKLGQTGLNMGQMQTLAKEFFAYAEGVIGKENVQKIAGAVPGLAQFL
jgi:hypothetical protein